MTWIHHLAGIYFMGVDPATARRVNITGTRTILDLARDAPCLERVVHGSTAMVSGDRRGTFHEDDLDVGQKFHNEYERTTWQADTLVRAAMQKLPITVLRPGIIVGDSQTGEIDRLDGPYYLMVLIATRRRPPQPRADRLRDRGGVARGAQRRSRGHDIPRPLTRAVLRTPGLSRLGRGPAAFVDLLDHPVHYDQANTTRALVGTAVRCPALSDYLPALVRYVLDVARPPTRSSSEDITDPLE